MITEFMVIYQLFILRKHFFDQSPWNWMFRTHRVLKLVGYWKKSITDGKLNKAKISHSQAFKKEKKSSLQGLFTIALCEGSSLSVCKQAKDSIIQVISHFVKFYYIRKDHHSQFRQRHKKRPNTKRGQSFDPLLHTFLHV